MIMGSTCLLIPSETDMPIHMFPIIVLDHWDKTAGRTRQSPLSNMHVVLMAPAHVHIGVYVGVWVCAIVLFICLWGNMW